MPPARSEPDTIQQFLRRLLGPGTLPAALLELVARPAEEQIRRQERNAGMAENFASLYGSRPEGIRGRAVQAVFLDGLAHFGPTPPAIPLEVSGIRPSIPYSTVVSSTDSLEHRIFELASNPQVQLDDIRNRRFTNQQNTLAYPSRETATQAQAVWTAFLKARLGGDPAPLPTGYFA